jgi:murein DD-endopeptidase MepM/ murein hydrolase activator NlpD
VRREAGAIEQLAAAEDALDRVRREVKNAQARLAGIERQIDDVRHALADLAAARAEVVAVERARAVHVYIASDGAAQLGEIFEGTSVAGGRRAVYAGAAQHVDEQSIDSIDEQVRAEEKSLASLTEQRDDARAAVVEGNLALGRAFTVLVALTAAFNDAGRGGRVFPIDGPFQFDDSWGAYRADVFAGTASHGHHATDIMAADGTPVVAIETGVLDRVGWNRLGGWRLWINGLSGTKYYYAHMRAYAPGLRKGSLVLAGQYVGRVGNTGNAQGGPPHLHIEVHVPDPAAPAPPPGESPGDGIVVNPYPLLCLLAGAPVPPIPPSDPPDPLPPPSSTTTTTTTAPRGR